MDARFDPRPVLTPAAWAGAGNPLPPPRALHLPDLRGREELAPAPAAPFLTGPLPDEIRAATGPIHRRTLLEPRLCNVALRLDADAGSFLLKIAQGAYRGQELWAEHAIGQAPFADAIGVPSGRIFLRDGDLTYFLRDFAPGVPLRPLFTEAEDLRQRVRYIEGMAEALARIHRQTCAGWTWGQWLDASLDLAERRMEAGVLDPEEFIEAPPASVLARLRAAKPETGTITLIHGDFRPKNLLWQEGRVAAVIDWAFADWGDPHYDLATIRHYLRGPEEWAAFVHAYSIEQIDIERLAYFDNLSKFINV